ncbi:MAG: putative toxin-antitoxin system toxin component, PIN family [Cyclobacteriaceae bacterium]|nr:putative toxin-antitoxin system toxin component, PIN family [Cyclobacteriaceae bacterium SS2]
MTNEPPIKVIFDTNIWISYLIGKQLNTLSNSLSNQKIQIVLTSQLKEELVEVTKHPKFKKYFKKKKVEELLILMDIIGLNYDVKDYPNICRDPKDNFLLGLIRVGKPHYLVTGDKDLLELNPFEETQIIKPADFQQIVLDELADR